MGKNQDVNDEQCSMKDVKRCFVKITAAFLTPNLSLHERKVIEINSYNICLSCM